MGFIDYISREPQENVAKILNFAEQFILSK